MTQWLTPELPGTDAASFTHLPHLPDPWRHLKVSYNSPFMVSPVAQRAVETLLPINAKLVRGRARSLGRVPSCLTLLLHFQMHSSCLYCTDSAAAATFWFQNASKATSGSEQNTVFTSRTVLWECSSDKHNTSNYEAHNFWGNSSGIAVMCTWASVHITCNASLSACSKSTDFPSFSLVSFYVIYTLQWSSNDKFRVAYRLEFSRIARKIKYNRKVETSGKRKTKRV